MSCTSVWLSSGDTAPQRSDLASQAVLVLKGERGSEYGDHDEGILCVGISIGLLLRTHTPYGLEKKISTVILRAHSP